MNQSIPEVLERISDAFVALDADWRCTYVNRRAAEVLGRSPESLVGRILWDEFPGSAESAFADACRRAARERTATTVEVHSEQVDRWFESRIHPSDDGVAVFLTDVTLRRRIKGRRQPCSALSSPDTPPVGEALRRQEAYFRALTEYSSDLVAVLEPDGRIRYQNPAAVRIIGYPAEEMAGLNAFSLVHPEDLPALRERFGRLFSSPEEIVSARFRFRHADGGWRVLEADGRNLLHDHAVRGLVINSRDVTARVRAEEALRASERRYREIFEQSRDPIYVAGIDGGLVDVNAAAEEAFGASREEILRHGIADLYADPEESPRILGRIREEGAVHDCEVRLRRLSGTEFDAVVSATLLLEGEEVVGIQGTVRDVTARREAEEALQSSEAWFRSLTQNALDIITVLDADGRIRYSTPSGSSTLGYEPGELRGSALPDLIHPEDRDQVEAALARLAHRGAEPITLAPRVRAKDGSWQVHETIAQSLLHDPAVQGIVVNSRDVTGQRLLEEQFRQAQKMEAVGRLAGGVAHDFNNVLMAIMGFAALLEGEVEPSEDSALYLTEIHKAAERAASLTRQLLAFGRKQSLRPKVVNLNSVVEGAGGMLRRLVREDIDLAYRLGPRLGACRVDPHQVEQVLMNLVVNATDALSGDGSIEISTRNHRVTERDRRTHPYLQAGSYIALFVRDTGHGMDAETLDRIFDPFFTTKEPGKGTGLGLSMVYGIVEQSGGYVWAESQPGKGSTFTVLLPRIPTEDETDSARTAGGALRRGSGTVLLAEDEEAVRFLARLSLQKAGYTVLEARDGVEALRVAEEYNHPIDLLLTDVVMPQLGGYALAERLRQRHPSLRVVYMSGYPGSIPEGAAPGVADPLAKPITPESLTQRVRDALR